jgi:hypothetical protein
MEKEKLIELLNELPKGTEIVVRLVDDDSEFVVSTVCLKAYKHNNEFTGYIDVTKKQ